MGCERNLFDWDAIATYLIEVREELVCERN